MDLAHGDPWLMTISPTLRRPYNAPRRLRIGTSSFWLKTGSAVFQPSKGVLPSGGGRSDLPMGTPSRLGQRRVLVAFGGGRIPAAFNTLSDIQCGLPCRNIQRPLVKGSTIISKSCSIFLSELLRLSYRKISLTKKRRLKSMAEKSSKHRRPVYFTKINHLS